MHPSVEQAIGRDRIRKAFKRYENNPVDVHDRGIVRAFNADGSYEVLLDGDAQTARCAPYAKAMVGDRVIVVTMKDGENVLLGRLGGEIESDSTEAPGPAVLYSNASGTNGSVKLSQSAANYAYLDVIYGNGEGRTSGVTRVYQPDGKTVEMSANLVGDNGYASVYFARYAVSGVTLTRLLNNALSATLNGDWAVSTAGNLYITQVIGYV